MARHDFRMPDIGEGIVDAEVVAWHVAVGDRVEEDAPLADVMTDKATVEITSPVAGTVVALGGAAGERITIGERLVEFETDGARRSAAADTGDAGGAASDVTADVDATTVAEDAAGDGTKAESEIKSDADTDDGTSAVGVATDADVADVSETEADATPDARETSGGPVSSARPGLSLNTPNREDKPHIRLSAEPARGVRRPKALASPAVRRRARELGIELAQVLGSGPDGRVLAADLEAGARARDRSAATALVRPPAASGTAQTVDATTQPADHVASGVVSGATDAAPERGTPAASRLPLDEDVPVIGLRRLIAERLAESSRAIPHFTYVEEIDVTELEALRRHLNARRDASRPRLSLLHFVLLGVCRAVRGWPQCNAHHDDERGTLRCHSAVHLGIATMTDDGLLVPVVRDADALDLDAMADAVTELAAAARAKRLPRERLAGSTITVTSLGALAGIATTPIINRPETAIVGPNRMTSTLVMRDGQVVERRVMNVSSSFDHRIVDGHDAASFIAELKALLEYPATLFL